MPPSDPDPDPVSAPPRRPHCAVCARPLGACICRFARPLANAVELLLLQHPHEQYEAKGTATLLRLSLARCRIVIGERFDAAMLLGDGVPTALLYPAEAGAAAAPPAGAPRRLILLDATWRKSRKLLIDNPWLAALPRLALDGLPPSRYAPLRRARREGQLSTLEAGLIALERLEGLDGTPLLEAFDGFVAARLTRPPR